MATPTIQRRRLGIALKRAREQAGKTQDDAAAVIHAAASKISRLELGQSGIRITDLALLLDLYGVTGEQADWMRELARAGRQRGRWSSYRTIIPDWFRTYIDLEADASEIRWYQAEVIPGILQTEGYIRAIHATTQPGMSRDQADGHVAVRLERQAVLTGPDAPSFGFILSESALRRNVGGPAIMREQLRYLAELADRPNIDLQVLPFNAQTYQPTNYDFTILRFNDDAASDVVYLEDYTGASYLDRPDITRAYTRLWNQLQASALGSVESQQLALSMVD